MPPLRTAEELDALAILDPELNGVRITRTNLLLKSSEALTMLSSKKQHHSPKFIGHS
jgi:hypothetical protein